MAPFQPLFFGNIEVSDTNATYVLLESRGYEHRFSKKMYFPHAKVLGRALLRCSCTRLSCLTHTLEWRTNTTLNRPRLTTLKTCSSTNPPILKQFPATPPHRKRNMAIQTRTRTPHMLTLPHPEVSAVRRPSAGKGSAPLV